MDNLLQKAILITSYKCIHESNLVQQCQKGGSAVFRSLPNRGGNQRVDWTSADFPSSPWFCGRLTRVFRFSLKRPERDTVRLRRLELSLNVG